MTVDDILASLGVTPDEAKTEETPTDAGAPDASTEADVNKDAWAAEYIDALPDASFLFIAPGGLRDMHGRTTPRSKRHFPVLDANGNPHEARVRDAIAGVPTSNIIGLTDAHKKMMLEKSRLLLAAVQKGVDRYTARSIATASNCGVNLSWRGEEPITF